MLVCPACRESNVEEAQFCTKCGRSMAPGPAFMTRVESKLSFLDDLEVQAPKPASPLRGILILSVLGLLLVGGTAFTLLRPDPCEGKYVSERFAYCVALPEGWQTTQLEEAAAQDYDAFTTDRTEAIAVVASEELAAGQSLQAPVEVSLEQWSQAVRSNEESQGLLPGQARATEVGGEEASTWQTSIGDPATGDTLIQTNIAVVHGGSGWMIVLRTAVPEDLESDLDAMIDSWSWR